ncbi:class I SAM-dependent methyltransferase [Paraburkholderia acidiphila]|uniref:Methyltransferase domain-containing protein n=1 Tax=Paraburkholderia acidiphila TaxID=2571747 RepID=A0A7Z2G2U7_9BURK|nr:class I SAM-dependent methyltransferase [Paraburkholderia acidiphila]QGZ53987.1 methyltransferase domain-containing protein [Paraburkholderia acidiphila]
MRYFSEKDLFKFDDLLKDIESHAQDNVDLLRRLDRYSVALTGDIAGMKAIDPRSDAYIEHVKAVHEEIIGRTHSSELEGLPELNADYEREWPYPWGTRSGPTVANFLIAYGLLLKVANLPPNARVLEVGCGMGSLTWNLARMGYRVDALDPNELQCQIVRNATKDFPVPPNVIAMTLDQWLSAKAESYKYDAVIFFESFHHVIDHRACLRELQRNHVEFDSKLILAAEPVFEKECAHLPYPWGPRLDGQSLRAMRRWGWLELGFTRSYIKQLFKELDLSFTWTKCPDGGPLSQIIVGYKEDNPVNKTHDSGLRYPASLSDGIDLSVDGMPNYVAKFDGLAGVEPWGRWTIGDRVKIKTSHRLPSNVTVTLDLTSVFGPNVHKNLKVRIGNHTVKRKLEPIEQKTTYEFHFENVHGNEIEILVPHPCRPKDIPQLGIEDPRRVGLGIKRLKIATFS